jgi:predicted RNase H-like HicB family nuclease
MRKYLIVIEKAEKNCSAYSPDLPGCVATGKAVAQAKKNIHAAIQFHLQGMREAMMPIPRSHTLAEYFAV